jgi:hypothetical protein
LNVKRIRQKPGAVGRLPQREPGNCSSEAQFPIDTPAGGLNLSF